MRDKVGEIITVTAFGLMFRFLVALAHGAVSHIARISATNLKKIACNFGLVYALFLTMLTPKMLLLC